MALRKVNLTACSERIAQLYLSAINGIESVLKIIYPKLASDYHAAEFAKALLKDDDFDRSQAVRVVAGQDLDDLIPFQGLSESKDGIPRWWSDHNELKHDRMRNFEKAQLGNLLDAMAAYFYLANLFMVKSRVRWEQESGKGNRDAYDTPDKRSTMFKLVEWSPHYQEFSLVGLTISK